MCDGCVPAGVPRQRSSRRQLVAGLAAVAAAARWQQTGRAARSFDLICPDAWEAQDHTGRYGRHEIERITIHHSAVVLRDNREAPARVRGHQRYHQSLGWPDIAYHVVVDRNGNVYKGRPFWAHGDSATDYEPRGHLLVMCEGNFDRQRVSRAQLRSLVDVVAWGCGGFDVAPRRIRGHRFHADTACPGHHLAGLIADGTIREAVSRRLDRGGVDKVDLCGRAARRRISAIERGDA